MDNYTLLTVDQDGNKHITITKASDLITASQTAELQHIKFYPTAEKIETRAANTR